TTLFISDLHLSPQEPRITNTFLHFLKIATSADAVYILGDLFEAYVGDDDDSGFMKQVTEAVTQFTKNGPPTFFMRGNRDLLVGKKWMQRSGMQLLEDPTVINLYQQKIILAHGDALCTDDTAHQRYRYWMQQPWVQKILLSLPLSLRRWIANRMRQKSQTHYSEQDLKKWDVVDNAVLALFKKYNVQTLIHGHTHKPAIHSYENAKRIVLDTWHQHGSYLEISRDGAMQTKFLEH
ncbi:MAG: UDP-2,3-diacylglucosamine diphosphatase, partial [Gammaproteobacteria bacterium RIFCSPHIGHO2_01_FULL_42_8]